MSKLKVSTISDPDNDNTALSIDTSGNVTASQGFVPSTQLSHRNLIINGAMQVAQRGTSVTGQTSLNSYKTVDRFCGNTSNVGSFTFNEEQSTDAPVDFSYSRKFTFTTASTTSANTRCQMRHHIELANVEHLNWGTSDAKPVTLSFWVKSSVTGNHPLSIQSSGETDSFVSNYTINTANTWEYKTINVSAPTSGTFTGSRLRLNWDFGSGSNYDAPSGDSWVSGWYYRLSSSVRPAETTNATWQITGVQLEVGSVATPFEHRSFGEELALCKRYYEKSFNYSTAPANSVYTQAHLANVPYADQWVIAAPCVQFEVEKRTTPSITYYGDNGKWQINNNSNGWDTFASIGATYQGTSGIKTKAMSVSIHNNGNSGYTTGYAKAIRGDWTADSEL